MNCISCGVEVSPAFKHAFSQNICPACGGSLIDEESLALIEDLGATLSSEATLRTETAHKLAIALVARYDIQLRGYNAMSTQPAARKQAAPIKIAAGTTQKLIQEHQAQSKIIMPDELQKMADSGVTISDTEREAIMADAVSRHYNLIDQSTASVFKVDGGAPELSGDDISMISGMGFAEGQEVPVLERERMFRLQKQQQALRTGGKNSFSRSS